MPECSNRYVANSLCLDDSSLLELLSFTPLLLPYKFIIDAILAVHAVCDIG
jgi:hypothetical protein